MSRACAALALLALAYLKRAETAEWTHLPGGDTMTKLWKPRVSRGIASLFTPAQCWAIESLELPSEYGETPYQALCEVLGIVLEHPPESCQECGEAFNNANTHESGLCAACRADDERSCDESARARRQEIADWEASR